jgi:hypothetical protein
LEGSDRIKLLSGTGGASRGERKNIPSRIAGFVLTYPPNHALRAEGGA